MIIFRQSSRTQNIYRTRPKAVCASPFPYIHCKQRMVPWPQAAQGHTPTLLLDPPLSSSFALKLQTQKWHVLGKLNVRLARNGCNSAPRLNFGNVFKYCIRGPLAVATTLSLKYFQLFKILDFSKIFFYNGSHWEVVMGWSRTIRSERTNDVNDENCFPKQEN